MSRMHRLALTAMTTVLLMLIATPAFAHVTVRADNTAPGGFATYTIRVPNEREESTTRIEVQVPEGMEASRYQPVPGWSITIEGGVITIEGGEIADGQFQDFSFSARNPEAAGDLVFPALQTYSGGEEVRWVGEPGSDEPAPVVTLTAQGEGVTPAGDGHGGAGHAGTESEDPVVMADTAGDDAADDAAVDAGVAEVAASDQGGSGPALAIAIVALALGLAGAGMGAASLSRSRKASEAAAA